jgi:hypothetical protein
MNFIAIMLIKIIYEGMKYSKKVSQSNLENLADTIPQVTTRTTIKKINKKYN